MNLSARLFFGLPLLCLSLLPLVATASKPNVLFIVCDDLNTHDSTSGYPHISTPAFDELAAADMTLRRAYCQYPVCGPSRASFLHGLYPQATGVLDNKSDIRTVRPGTVSMPQRFKESGYWTGAVGKVFHNAKINPGDVVTPPAELQGQSLAAMLLDPATSGKGIAYTIVKRGDQLGKAIRTQRYRYTWWSSEEELYDLGQDPYEQANLTSSPKHAGVLETMRTILASAETNALSEKTGH